MQIAQIILILIILLQTSYTYLTFFIIMLEMFFSVNTEDLGLKAESVTLRVQLADTL